MNVEETEYNLADFPDRVEFPTPLEKREAAVWTFELELKRVKIPLGERVSLQFPARDILQTVPENGKLKIPVSVPRNVLEHATHARLRLVQAGFNPVQHFVRVNGTRVKIQPGGIGIMDAEFPLSAVQTDNTIEIERMPGSSWCTIQSASLFLEQVPDGETDD
jgi:hypothetical protein